MPDITIIQLLPDKPISAADFTNALNGLVIRAFDISFNNPEGTLVGEASQSRIAQHYLDRFPDPIPFDIPALQSVATAIIEIENNLPEYGIESPDGKEYESCNPP